MTTGTRTTDETISGPYFIDGSNNGTIKSGKLRTKTWSGIDGLPLTPEQKGPIRTYTTIDRRGKVVTRKFRERPLKRLKFKEPHPYTMSAYSYESGRGEAFVQTQFWNQHYTNWTFSADNPSLPPLPNWTANDDIKLINKLKERVRGSDFNLGIFLGEGHQVLQMIGDSAIRIARGIKLLKKGNVIGAVHEMSKSAQQTAKIRSSIGPKGLWTTNLRRNASQQLSNNWLELQYGWLPLLGDIHEGAILLAHQLNVPFRQRYRARVRLKGGVPESYIWGFAEGYSLYRKQIVAYISESESIPKLLGLLDPELILWELTPFSFVADWFAPFGDWLDARAFTSSLTGLFVTTTTRVQVGKGIVGKSFDTGLIHGYSTAAVPGFAASQMSMTREISTSLMVPKPVVKPLSKVASWKHCANGLALLTQMSKTHLKSPPRVAKPDIVETRRSVRRDASFSGNFTFS